MVRHRRIAGLLASIVVGSVVLLCRCGRSEIAEQGEAIATPPVPADAPRPASDTESLPDVTAVELDRSEVPRYESIEMTVALEADYANPYDLREVSLDGLFIGPDGTAMAVPGFWDGEESWRVRFTPSQEGEWTYRLIIQDARGASPPAEGRFNVTPSDLHGWLQVGRWVNPDFSGHYLVYHDGTPFYGAGHCDALNILVDGFDAEEGVRLFDKMKESGENYVVWWPLYTNSPVTSSYDKYSVSNLNLIDLVVADAQKGGVVLVFTIWDHPQLRDENHEWDTGNWARNGFSKLGTLDSFFTTAEAWAWQENFYRYIIARWGYSPAIGLWQTVSEINGTNAYDQTDPWHSRVNAYFVGNDPYRHPTTASMSGDADWAEGHRTMDVPQMHVYALENDAVKAAEIIAGWTALMWDRAEKPNWIGEFGVGGDTYYPELFHNAIWAALASGAAMTPAEWNSSGFWGRMTPEMNADIGRLAGFVAELPLAQWNPAALEVVSSDPEVRGWGVAGTDGGLLWVQDFALEEMTIAEVRRAETLRQNVVLEVQGMAEGAYTVHPYHTWQGTYLESFDLHCTGGPACTVALPEFSLDMAFRVERK
jgi:hypothetical protein